MFKKVTISLLICLALLTTAVGCAPTSSGEAAESPVSEATPTLEATIEVPATLTSGEVVKLRFTLTNNTDTRLYVLKWYTPLEGIMGKIFRVERDGQVIPYQGILATRVAPPPEAYILLDAGESVSAEVDLATAYDFSKAGEYTIEFLSPSISHVAKTEAEMAKTLDDLGPVQIPSNRVTVEIGGSLEFPAKEEPTKAREPVPTEGEEDPYPGWESYVNADYGFAFHYPTTWTLEEEANLVKLSQGTLLLAIAFQRQGEDVPPPWSGMPAGDFESRGSMVFLGQEIAKNSLVYEGKVKVLRYSAKIDDLVFSIRLEDVVTADYRAIQISETVQSEVDQIVGSFETIAAEEVEPGIAIMGTVMDVSLSARIIMLREPVEGFSVIALTEESELVSAEGDEITLRAIRPGMRIQASGQPGESNALLASKVRLLEAMPTSPSD
jgi:hypothetical protein